VDPIMSGIIFGLQLLRFATRGAGCLPEFYRRVHVILDGLRTLDQTVIEIFNN